MDAFTSYFAQQGILGIIIIMLVGVVLWQQKRIDGKDKIINEIQDKRKNDVDAYTASYIATTREMVGTQKDSLNALILLQRSVDNLANAWQGIIAK